MIIIETKRHPIKFYTTLALGLLFLLALGSFMIFTDLDKVQEGQSKTKEYIMPIFGLLIYFLAIWMVYSYLKNSPKITIDTHYLKIGAETFYLKNIKDVALTGKMPFRLIMNFPMEGTAILFNDGTEKILFDDMYTNSHEVKSFLEQVVLNKQEFKLNITEKINKADIRFENTEIFKGNLFKGLREILLWGLIGFFAYLLIGKWLSPPPSKLWIFLGVFGFFGIFWFLLNSWITHYFGLTKDFLIVRNYNFFRKEKIYRLSDIKEVVFEIHGRQPKCMRIITTDFRNTIYQAATLKNSRLLEMKRALEAKGIKVRNESIYQ
jgi:hypothetical protein